MRSKAKTTAAPTPPVPTISGKWLIIGVVAVALAGAGGSWWFRYQSTHRVAEFWGSDVARLIRDAPRVELLRLGSPNTIGLESSDVAHEVETANYHDVSKGRGLVHLRNALLQDRSYDWPPQPKKPRSYWSWALRFRDDRKGEREIILIGADCDYVTNLTGDHMLASRPILDGLHKMFAELEHDAQKSR
jgi:hypothetical protein